MEKRFIVKSVVSDYGVFDTQYGEGERLDCICSAKANADLIADILNTDYSKPNECTYYENELQQENKELKEQVDEQIDYKDEYYCYWKHTQKENTILKKALKEAEEIVRKTLDYYLHRMSFDDIQKDDLQYNYWSKKAKKCEDVIRVIEQAKESL